ncbi:MAG: hypothetical protein HMLKMBBP_03914 [Planctomycetes bacterium]|nr:hypothetical protein [Planctomycetota bacterium]
MEPRGSGLSPLAVVLLAAAVSAAVSAGVATAVMRAGAMQPVPAVVEPPRVGSAAAAAAPPPPATDASRKDEDPPLEGAPGTPTRVRVTDENPVARIRYVLPEGTVAVLVRATSRGPAFRCRVLEESDGGEEGAELGASVDPAKTHVFSLTEHATDGFPVPAVIVEIEADGADGADGAEAAGIDIESDLDVVRTTVAGTVPAGDEFRGVLTPESGHRATVAVRVPAGSRVLRLDLAGCDADLDLYAEDAGPTGRTAEMTWRSSRPLAEETLLCDFDGPEPPPDVVHVTVADPSHSEEPVRFTLVTTPAATVPARLRAVDPLPIPSEPKALAMLSTVEVLTDDGGGSGVLVSPRGHVLTACHVVEGALGADAPKDAIAVAVTLDPRRISRDRYLATVVFHDEERDLALLRITSALRGVDLPAGHAFPCAPLSAASPSPGDELVTVGFPGIGGAGTRAPVTVSRGVLAGFDRGRKGLVAKTDALVSPGSSGGGVFDAAWRLCGIAVSSTDDGGGNSLGYLVPAEELPAEWLGEIRKR